MLYLTMLFFNEQIHQEPCSMANDKGCQHNVVLAIECTFANANATLILPNNMVDKSGRP